MTITSGIYQIEGKSDRFVKEVLEQAEYAYAEGDKVVIDIGANIGCYSMYIYPRASVIYAVEPSKEYEYLDKNVKTNGLDKIKAFNIALGGSNGTRKFINSEGTGGSGFAAPDQEGDMVETRTLATFMREQGIGHVDLLKIDVEGAEHEIFEADDFKDVSGSIDLIFGERHGSSISDTLSKHGFDYRDIANNHFIARNKHEKN